MTWKEIHEHKSLNDIRNEMSPSQAMYTALAMTLDIASALVLVSDLDLDTVKDIDQPTKLAEKLEEIFGKDQDPRKVHKCILLLEAQNSNGISE